MASYKYYQADKFKTAKEVLKEQDKARRKRVLIMSLILGGGGALGLGALPIIDVKRQGREISKQTFMDSLTAGAVGGGLGLGLTGLI